MAERGRVLLEAAIVSAVVGATAAGIVAKYSAPDDDARVHDRLPPPPTLTTAEAPPPDVAPTAQPPIAPPSDTAEPLEPDPPPADELTSIEADAAIDLAELLDAGAPAAEVVAETSVDAGVAAAAPPKVAARADAGAPYATAQRGPTFSGGAGRFLSEPPRWGASAWTSDPNAGAGRFLTTPDPWGASAMTPNPQAGAGPFTTERNYSGGFVVFPPVFVLPVPGDGAEGAEGAEGADGAEENNPFAGNVELQEQIEEAFEGPPGP